MKFHFTNAIPVIIAGNNCTSIQCISRYKDKCHMLKWFHHYYETYIKGAGYIWLLQQVLKSYSTTFKRLTDYMNSVRHYDIFQNLLMLINVLKDLGIKCYSPTVEKTWVPFTAQITATIFNSGFERVFQFIKFGAFNCAEHQKSCKMAHSELL